MQDTITVDLPIEDAKHLIQQFDPGYTFTSPAYLAIQRVAKRCMAELPEPTETIEIPKSLADYFVGRRPGFPRFTTLTYVEKLADIIHDTRAAAEPF